MEGQGRFPGAGKLALLGYRDLDPAQLQLGGFYPWVARKVAELPLTPAALVGAVVIVAGVLSSVFSNDIVCLSMAPVLATTR